MQWGQENACSVTTTILGTPVNVSLSEAYYENVTCKMSNGSPYRPVSSSPSPPSGVTGKAFNTTGVDYAGPLYAKSLTEYHQSKDVYVSLFTCAAIRALYSEVVGRRIYLRKPLFEHSGDL